jgi:ATP-dependent Clp protease protease subunit
MVEEIWYTLTGDIEQKSLQDLAFWVNGQIYNNPIKCLKLVLSSKGGDIDSAIQIYFYLKALPFDVEVIAFGQVDSAANLIYLAGKKRLATKDCRFLLHDGLYTIGNPKSSLNKHEETLELLKQLDARNICILSEEIGKNEDEIKKLLNENTFLTTVEAKKLGIVHEIIEKLPLKMITK